MQNMTNDMRIVTGINYEEIGNSMLRTAIGCDSEIYEYINPEDFDSKVKYKMAEEFINDYPNATLDYLAKCMHIVNQCKKDTNHIISDIVKKATMEMKLYYWNDWLGQFCPTEKLENAIGVMAVMNENIKWDVKHDLGTYIDIKLSNEKAFKLVSDDKNFILRDENEDITSMETTSELLEKLNELEEEVENVKFNTILECSMPERDEVEVKCNLVVFTNGKEYIDISEKDCCLIQENELDLTNCNKVIISSLRDLYGYFLKNKIDVNPDRISDNGFLLGASLDLVVSDDLKSKYLPSNENECSDCKANSYEENVCLEDAPANNFAQICGMKDEFFPDDYC